MRFQETKSSCGAAAIRNVLKCFGKNIGEHRLRQLAQTDEDGTSEAGVLSALDHLGFTSEVFETEKAGDAKAALSRYMKAGMPMIVAVDQDTHWATVVGQVGKRYVIVDSERTVKNKKENGVHVLDIRGLFRRWRKPDGTMYAIAVKKK